MMKEFHRLIEKAEEHSMRSIEQEYRLRHLEQRVQPVFEYVRLMFEATAACHQERLDIIGIDGIGKYTLSEVESCRFMTDRQFNNMRASKRV